MKYPSKIIREFEKFPYISYERRSPQTWSHWKLILSSNTACRVYDDSWYRQLACLLCKNGNDWYAIDSDLACLLYGREQIRRVTSGKNFITGLFYRRGQINNHYCWWNFYGGKRIIVRPKKHIQRKICKERGRAWGIYGYRWYSCQGANLF